MPYLFQPVQVRVIYRLRLIVSYFMFFFLSHLFAKEKDQHILCVSVKQEKHTKP